MNVKTYRVLLLGLASVGIIGVPSAISSEVKGYFWLMEGTDLSAKTFLSPKPQKRDLSRDSYDDAAENYSQVRK